jgi:hypothetical protein
MSRWLRFADLVFRDIAAQERCPDCGGKLRPSQVEARVVQQVELIDRPVEIVEHPSAACRCSRCRKNVYAPLPLAVEKGRLAGPNLTGLGGLSQRCASLGPGGVLPGFSRLFRAPALGRRSNASKNPPTDSTEEPY